MNITSWFGAVFGWASPAMDFAGRPFYAEDVRTGKVFKGRG
jgi:hypothetical protein